MTADVLHKTAYGRIRQIHRLSQEYNRLNGTPHDQRLLDMVRHHAEEIRDLHRQKDPHYLTETGDLIVLCCELLLEGRAPVDQTLLRCLERFEQKLTELIRQAQPENNHAQDSAR